MSRTESRRMAFEILYSFEIQKLPISEQKEQLELYIENNEIQDKKVIEYLEDATNGISENEKEIEKNISDNLAKNWQIDRISKIDIAILKLAIYEILYKKSCFENRTNGKCRFFAPNGEKKAFCC